MISSSKNCDFRYPTGETLYDLPIACASSPQHLQQHLSKSHLSNPRPPSAVVVPCICGLTSPANLTLDKLTSRIYDVPTSDASKQPFH